MQLGLVFWQAVGTAFLCGGLIGLERQLRGKPVGVRTSILVCLGTVIFIHLSIMAVGETGDPSRVLGQVVTGIGFLGAGVMISRNGTLYGVTTAAVIWMLAALGCLIGFGQFLTAIIVTLIILALLVGIQWVEDGVKRLRSDDDLKANKSDD